MVLRANGIDYGEVLREGNGRRTRLAGQHELEANGLIAESVCSAMIFDLSIHGTQLRKPRVIGKNPAIRKD